MTRRHNGGALIALQPGTTARWTPWSGFRILQRESDHLMADVLDLLPGSRLPANHAPDGGPIRFSPDVYETDSELVIILPIPGIDPNNVTVEATSDTLTVRGEIKPFFEDEKAVQHRRSLWTAVEGAFHWSYPLLADINAGKISASYKNGLLDLRLPKVQAAKPTTVKVNVTTK